MANEEDVLHLLLSRILRDVTTSFSLRLQDFERENNRLYLELQSAKREAHQLLLELKSLRNET